MPDAYSALLSLNQKISSVVNHPDASTTLDVNRTKNELVDDLIEVALFSSDESVRDLASKTLYQFAEISGIYPSSMYPLYQAFGQEKVKGFTVPAINIRMLTFDIARHIFKLIKKHHIGTVVFEISRTEMTYTDQSPKEYALAVIAAAIKEEYQGPVFLQGDHFQVNPKAFIADQKKELQELKDLIAESLKAKFFNIDLDASTLVDLKAPDITKQQVLNSHITAELARYIRSIKEFETPISIGAEIGHIGDRNSTPEDLDAFMNLFLHEAIEPGLSKISVQTGSSHGGTPLPDGTLKQPKIDFTVLENISCLARSKFHIGGAVQHGASTLPISLFHQFTEHHTLEIHLSTGLQNIVFETMPEELKKEIYAWMDQNLVGEKRGLSDEQFYYTLRKKSLGHFKKHLWDLLPEEKDRIATTVAYHLEEIFLKLNLKDSRDIVEQFIP